MKTQLTIAAAVLTLAACTPKFYPPQIATPESYVYGAGFSSDTTGVGERWSVRTPDQRKYGRPATGPAGRPALEKCKKPRTGRGFLRIYRGRADDPFRYIGFSTV